MRDLAAHSTEAQTPAEACSIATKVISGSGKFDIPFASLYLLGPHRKTAVLAANVSIEKSSKLCPEVVDLHKQTDDHGGVEDKHEGSSAHNILRKLFNLVISTGKPQELNLAGFGTIANFCCDVIFFLSRT